MESDADENNNLLYKWSITPFLINDMPNQIGGASSDVKYVWHVQPMSSKPSAKDNETAFDQINNNGMNKSTWFVIGAKDNRVSFFRGTNKYHTISMDEFKRMNRQE